MSVPYCNSLQWPYSPGPSSACLLPFTNLLEMQIGELDRAGHLAPGQSSYASQSTGDGTARPHWLSQTGTPQQIHSCSGNSRSQIYSDTLLHRCQLSYIGSQRSWPQTCWDLPRSWCSSHHQQAQPTHNTTKVGGKINGNSTLGSSVQNEHQINLFCLQSGDSREPSHFNWLKFHSPSPWSSIYR